MKSKLAFIRILAVIALLLSDSPVRSQVFPDTTGAWGIRPHRGAFDRTLYFPTGCGAPTDSTYLFSLGYGHGQILAQAAKYYDSCGGHEYVWDPKTKSWHCSDCGTGGGGSGFSIHALASANFSGAVNCPIPALNHDSLQVYWNDASRFLQEGTEWQNLTGGGFTVLVPGFNASSNSYSLTLYANNIAYPPGPQNFTSSNFTSATNCPITAYNGMTLNIYWNDAQRYLIPTTEWTPFAGGGFTVLVPGFDATSHTYSFYVFAQ